MTDYEPDHPKEVAGVAPLPATYPQLLADIKTRIQQARTRAALSVNAELIRLYWEIGGAIVERQRREGWGAGVIERLSVDLRRAFPALKGFSARNIWRMRSFYLAYSGKRIRSAGPLEDGLSPTAPMAVATDPSDFLPSPMAEIPWTHNMLLQERLGDTGERQWYAARTLDHGWSVDVLSHQIDSDLYHRQGQAITNFEATLPPPDSDLAKRLLKDPYAFDFLDVGDQMAERKLERGLIDRLQHLLLELGRGFAFVGSQYRIEVGGEDFYIDLVFYHLELRRFVLIDLKTGKFKPEYVGKMGFYLTTVDRQMRHAQDAPSIGLILCREHNRLVVEYTLQDVTRPMGVATYATLPEEIRKRLPSPELLAAELSEDT